ncbi:hypothetical protein DYB32_003396 [Aphanomyces invadans]|uniref:Uncharacterized protein n=1 Tax=Aphanomyces invadans TaxID=157072 RepID=A0A3R6WP20_9STRA|nr:hypothetical protein DYB32_003396 [Aphanomyces invadans]
MSSFRTLASFSVHPPGIGDLDILPNGIAVTCGEDGYVCFTDMKELKEIKSMRIVTDDGTVPSISVSATTSSDGSSRDVFVASSDNYLLNRYSLGAKATFEGCYLRCTEEIKYISSSKSYVAVVSEDLRSRIVLRANMERVLVLEGHKEPVKSIAIDPLETYVATAASDNTVKLFDISNVDGDTGEVNASGSIPIQYQQGMSNDDVLARVAWQPEAGSLLATPMRMNTVGLYERGTWTLSSKLVFPSFEGVFNSDVNVIAFSPNGKYVAAASMAKQARSPSCLPIDGLTTHTPDDAIVDEEEQVNAIKRSFGFDPDMAVLHEATVPDDEDDLDASATQAAMDAPLLNSSVVPMSSAAGQHYVQQVQATFQPGAVLQGPVILLAWNLLGDIEALSSADQTPLIVLRFNDKSKRGFKFHDTYNLTMADFDDVGAIFAAPTQDDMPAVVTYRAIESWNSSSSWHVSLPDGEDVVCVTTAGSFCFVASSTHFVRVYSMGGILLAIFALSGRIVSMASHRSGKLAVLYATSSAELHYAVYTIQASLPRVQKVAEGVMPPTKPPSTPLTVAAPAVEWVGFNDLGVLFFVQAGTGTVFALSSLVGLQWMPLVQPSHTHGPIFCVGIRDGTVYFLPKVLDQPLQLPRHHRPVLSTWAYEKVEDDALWAAHNAATVNPSDPIDYVVPRQAAADKAILLRVKAMCASDDVQKAYDLATCLSLEKSHAIAQQIATHFGLRELQSRLQQLQDSLFPIDTRPSIEVDAAAPTSMERRPPTAGSSSLRPPSRIPIMSRNATSPQTSTAPTDPVAKPPSKPTASTFVNPFKKREVAQEQKADSGSRKRQK